jgi:ATP-dependent Clp protease adaptor protein ClpS
MERMPATATPATRPEIEKAPASDSDTQTAPRWKVLLLNDDVTTFEFVIELLCSLFKKERAESVRLTHEIHETGSALITVTTFERAELYVEQVRSLARPRGYPLTATIEPE